VRALSRSVIHGILLTLRTIIAGVPSKTYYAVPQTLASTENRMKL